MFRLKFFSGILLPNYYKKVVQNISLTVLIFTVSFPSVFGQTYFDMSAGNYSETFTSWTTPSTNSWSSVATNAGVIPTATSVTTQSATFSTGTTGGIQNGNTNIQFLSTGTTDNSSSVALDLNLNFTGKNAGTLAFDAATVFNSTGNRAGTLRVYYSINGTTWSELTATNLPFTTNNNVAKSASISLTLPSTIDNQSTVKLRFYYHNGGPPLPSPTGSRPKISIDNVNVTSTSSGPNIAVSPSSITNLNYFTGNGPSNAGSYILTGSSLTSDIAVTSPSNFEISTSSNLVGFGNVLLISPTAGSINDTIFVRLISGLSPATYIGNVTHAGGGITVNPTVSLSGTVSDIVTPTKLAITAINPISPIINTTFSITVQAQDNSSTAQNVVLSTTFSISLNTGTGNLAGTLTGTIPAGSNTVTVSGLTYDKEESGVILSANVTNGDALMAGNSPSFNLVDNSPIIRSVQSGNWNSTTSWSCNCIPQFSDTVRIKTTHTINVIDSPNEQGCAKIIFENGGILNIQTGNFKMGFPVVPVISTNINLAMGNPSGATTNTAFPDNYLLDKPQYVLSYNRTKATSNWVSWYLNSSSIGSAPRQNDFRVDNTLPAGWYQVNQNDYSGSGFDRGHMTPSGDRTSTIPDNSATFLMTNMIPQAPGNNQGPWEKLESYLRTQISANGGQEIYIISGSYGIGGTGTAGFMNTIAGGKITVPAYTYKIAIILSNGTDDVNRVTTSTRVIAVVMPNIDSIRPDDWRPYRTTVDAIEGITGYNYLSNVPVSIQDVIESITDTVAN